MLLVSCIGILPFGNSTENSLWPQNRKISGKLCTTSVAPMNRQFHDKDSSAVKSIINHCFSKWRSYFCKHFSPLRRALILCIPVAFAYSYSIRKKTEELLKHFETNKNCITHSWIHKMKLNFIHLFIYSLNETGKLFSPKHFSKRYAITAYMLWVYLVQELDRQSFIMYVWWKYAVHLMPMAFNCYINMIIGSTDIVSQANAWFFVLLSVSFSSFWMRMFAMNSNCYRQMALL